jgi:hypothetical protein
MPANSPPFPPCAHCDKGLLIPCKEDNSEMWVCTHCGSHLRHCHSTRTFVWYKPYLTLPEKIYEYHEGDWKDVPLAQSRILPFPVVPE